MMLHGYMDAFPVCPVHYNDGICMLSFVRSRCKLRSPCYVLLCAVPSMSFTC